VVRAARLKGLAVASPATAPAASSALPLPLPRSLPTISSLAQLARSRPFQAVSYVASVFLLLWIFWLLLWMYRLGRQLAHLESLARARFA
jgi:hypothetical protein